MAQTPSQMSEPSHSNVFAQGVALGFEPPKTRSQTLAAFASLSGVASCAPVLVDLVDRVDAVLDGVRRGTSGPGSSRRPRALLQTATRFVLQASTDAPHFIARLLHSASAFAVQNESDEPNLSSRRCSNKRRGRRAAGTRKPSG